MSAAQRHYRVPTRNSSASCISVTSAICIASVINVASASRLRHQRLLRHLASTHPPQPSRLHLPRLSHLVVLVRRGGRLLTAWVDP
ncbi:hypothetical protein ACLOJK_009576 [Asimina triloba]